VKETLQLQYDMVRSSRTVLLEYCDTIEHEHFILEHPGFGRGGSMRSILAHTGNSYEGWIAKRIFKRIDNLTPHDSFNTIDDFRIFFRHIDELVHEFLTAFEENYNRALTIQLYEDKIISATPLEVFTHVITHEFHHKGQILSISRHMGYIPVDTDVLR
jgi:uncharacterized damage-inducible protein DinB